MSASDPSAGGRFGRFEIVLAERRLQADGQPVALGSRAFDLLAALVARRDRIVPKDELIDVVWPGLVVEDNNLQVQISALRKVLGAQAIATVPGRGYQFTIAAGTPSSPAAAPAVETKAPRSPERSTPGAQRKSRLLVADDNKVNRLLLCRSLELMGHDVASVENGRAALEALRRDDFDMLLLDLEMPELDGFGLLEQRAADTTLHDVPVIVTSSLEGAAQVARCIELGADDYLHKPVNPVLLKARVGASLERKHLRDRQRELLARLAPDMGDGASVDGSGARRGECTLLVAALHGIDALAATQDAQDTLELLSSWTTLMLDTLEDRGGLVNQLAGDRMTALFGARGLAPKGGAPAAAVLAAQDMQELVTQFNAERTASGKAPIVLRIGIASGELVTGHAGTPHRSAYVCIGAAAERATRLAALAGERGLSAALDGATQAALPASIVLDPLRPIVMPGEKKAAVAYALGRP